MAAATAAVEAEVARAVRASVTASLAVVMASTTVVVARGWEMALLQSAAAARAAAAKEAPHVMTAGEARTTMAKVTANAAALAASRHFARGRQTLVLSVVVARSTPLPAQDAQARLAVSRIP